MVKNFEYNYLRLVASILATGEVKSTRNGSTKSLFGTTLDIDMSNTNTFPLLLSRKMHPLGILGEMAAFLRGPKSVKDFEDQGCNYWKKWGKPDGTINVDYGNSWLDFNGYNQLRTLVDTIKSQPNDRRLLISGWNPANLPALDLPCCHLLYQWYVREGKYLDMVWYQRSADTMIGIPSDIVLAAIFNILLANEVGLKPGRIKMIFGDTHIYEEHFDMAEWQVKRGVPPLARYPEYVLNMPQGQRMEEFTNKKITIVGYHPQPSIKYELKE